VAETPNRLALPLARGFAAVVLLTSACTKVTTVSSESPLQVQARPPASPLPDLPAVPQPAPRQRVVLEGDLLLLDEPLTFDEAERLGEHREILAEVARWLAKHPEVLELSVEVHSVGKATRRKHVEQSKALAMQIVDALVEAGVERERLLAGSVGASPDDQRHIALRISKRAEDQE
jgi:hypothetical protein